jgi:hypothetical protein
MSTVRPHMPAYAWSCASCGATNVAAAELCGTCGCPAAATATQVKASLEAHLTRGGAVYPHRAAGALQSELSATQVFGPVALLLLGVLPSHLRRVPSAPAVLVMTGSALLLVSLSSMNWAWLPLSTQARSLASSAGLAGAVLCLLLVIVLALTNTWRAKSAQSKNVV